MTNLYIKTDFVHTRSGGSERKVYTILEDDEDIPEGWTLIKTNLSQEQIDFLEEIRVIGTKEFRQFIRNFGLHIKSMKEQGKI